MFTGYNSFNTLIDISYQLWKLQSFGNFRNLIEILSFFENLVNELFHIVVIVSIFDAILSDYFVSYYFLWSVNL